MSDMKRWKEAFASNLKKLRKGGGWTQVELAQKICVTDACISRWEKGQRIPTLIAALKLAKIFHVSLNDLIQENK